MNLATLWFPDSNPVGPASVVALVIALAFTLPATLQAMALSKTQRTLIGIAPLILLLLYVVMPGSLPGRSFPDGEHYAARAIYVGFGLGFSVRNFRFIPLAHRLSAAGFGLVYSLLIVHMALAEGATLLLSAEIDPLINAGYLGAVLCWAVVAVLLNAATMRPHLRRLANLCPQCGYDLRASKERCPECGTPMPSDTASGLDK